MARKQKPYRTGASELSTVPVHIMMEAIYEKSFQKKGRKGKKAAPAPTDVRKDAPHDFATGHMQPPPEPSPYTLRERAKRAAYEEWLKNQAMEQTGLVSTRDDQDAQVPSTGATLTSAGTPPDTPEQGGTMKAAPTPMAIPTYENPAEPAYVTVPFRGGRTTLRDLATSAAPASRPDAGGPTVSAKTTPKALPDVPFRRQQDRPITRTSGFPSEMQAKNITAVTTIRVAADRRTLLRMSPVQREQFVRDDEAVRIGASREVRCGGGWCDLLNSAEIVEVKAGHAWRHALGQVLAYGFYWPNHAKRVHLFDVDSRHLEECVRVCAAFGVAVSVAQPRDDGGTITKPAAQSGKPAESRS